MAQTCHARYGKTNGGRLTFPLLQGSDIGDKVSKESSRDGYLVWKPLVESYFTRRSFQQNFGCPLGVSKCEPSQRCGMLQHVVTVFLGTYRSVDKRDAEKKEETEITGIQSEKSNGRGRMCKCLQSRVSVNENVNVCNPSVFWGNFEKHSLEPYIFLR